LTQRQVRAIFLWKLSLQGRKLTLQSNGESDNIDPPVLQHTRAVAMARSQQPDSASSQFYTALGSVFSWMAIMPSTVTNGMDDKIQQGDRIESAKVTQGLGKSQKC